jgi:hypothetical protein
MTREKINHLISNFFLILILIIIGIIFIYVPDMIQNFFLIPVKRPEAYNEIIISVCVILWVIHLMHPWMVLYAFLLTFLAVVLILPLVFNYTDTDNITYIIFITIILTSLTNFIIALGWANKE